MVTAVILCLGLWLWAMPALAQQDFAIDPEASCSSASCHDDLGKQKFVHAPAADGEECAVCHETVQEGRHGFELVAEEETELCGQCHGDVAEKEFKHVPVAEGLCTFCHDPHQSENQKQLLFPATAELCFNCHDEDAFAGNTIHGPIAEGLCLKCHDAHSSDHGQQLLAEAPDLCFGCHNRTLKDPEGTALPSPKRAFENEQLQKHLPFEAGDCLSCHLPHAGENHRLLAAPYPKTLYTRFSPEAYICFNCHDETAFAEPRTLSDTRFRNGNLNLHFRHVNRDKGRSCRACHHHHAAPNAKMIRDQIPFGKRTINIRNFALTETGGSCAPTCHRAVSYDRYEPVVNELRVTPRQGVDATPEELKRARKEEAAE